MKLIINCFNGMQSVIREDANATDLQNLAVRREAQDYEVSWLCPTKIEVNSDGMVDDRMGIISLVADTWEPTN